jgi:cellulose synthase/poly-beta-1,6-N-acetylglucosamine synthase-like glycosyltransferase
VIAPLYALVALWLAIYGLNSFILALFYLRYRHARVPILPVDWSALPAVTVQVPVYNERHVIERVIDAVAVLDYPRDRLHIQILDDSTDETTQLAQTRAAMYREQGVDIVVLRRPHREGFKAGALAAGLCQTCGEYVAIFDADFRPHPDFLLQTIPHFLAHPRLGLIQTRWSCLNADYSLFTRAQVLALDGYFIVEQTGRQRAGLLVGFNGASGVWRRRCIQESGGWQSDTLCEDLDLSYRAQLAGWECLYLPEVDAPAEVPPQIAAFKQQQARWAQGSQTGGQHPTQPASEMGTEGNGPGVFDQLPGPRVDDRAPADLTSPAVGPHFCFAPPGGVGPDVPGPTVGLCHLSAQIVLQLAVAAAGLATVGVGRGWHRVG